MTVFFAVLIIRKKKNTGLKTVKTEKGGLKQSITIIHENRKYYRRSSGGMVTGPMTNIGWTGISTEKK